MANKEESQLVVTDLPIALYLNQQVTFDILAALEDGFSRFSTVQTTFSGEKSTEISGEAPVGANLTLFGMKFGGRRSRQTGQAQSESTMEEIIHTPASLFARLRRDLRSRGLVTDLLDPSDRLERTGRLAAPIAASRATGIVKVNRAPRPGPSLSAHIRPPWVSIIPLQMARPRPDPAVPQGDRRSIEVRGRTFR